MDGFRSGMSDLLPMDDYALSRKVFLIHLCVDPVGYFRVML